MKRFFFTNSNTQKSDGNAPFWKPFGLGKYLGRLVLTLLSVGLLLFLLSLIKQCDGNKYGYDKIDPPQKPIEVTPIDTVPEIEIPDIPDTNLPVKDSNRIVKPEPDKIKPAPDSTRYIVTNVLNVLLNSKAGDETFKQWAAEFKALYPEDYYKIEFYSTYTKLLQISVPEDRREYILENLNSQIPDIDFKVFEEELFNTASSAPFDDPAFENADRSWYFEPIQAYEAWKITTGDPKIVVAIVDSYFDLTHAELNSPRMRTAYSVENRSSNVAPPAGLDETSGPYFHGSCVASMAIGNANNGVMASGIAPGCGFLPVSVGQTVTSMRLLEGILYAIYQGANVINISMGASFTEEARALSIDDQVMVSLFYGSYGQDVWDYVFKLADQRRVTIVWAAGNDNVLLAMDNSKRGDNTIRVSSVGHDLGKSNFSNYGNLDDWEIYTSTISAPGQDILGAVPKDRVKVGDGTSYAAPIVAGAVALIKSVDPTLTNPQIIQILQKSARPIPLAPTIGPLLQIKDALLLAGGSVGTVEDLTDFDGLWQSMEVQSATRYDAEGNVIEDKIQVDIFLSISRSGKSEVIIREKTDIDNLYRAVIAPVSDYDGEGVLYLQHGTAEATGGEHSYQPYYYLVSGDSEGHLICTILTVDEDPNTVNVFKLKRVERIE